MRFERRQVRVNSVEVTVERGEHRGSAEREIAYVRVGTVQWTLDDREGDVADQLRALVAAARVARLQLLKLRLDAEARGRAH